MTESLIENDIGCGAFQIVITVLALMSVIPTYFSVMMMSFGSYNPGWTCLDNNSSYVYVNDTDTRVMSIPDNQTTDYRKDLSCELFKTCQHVEFDPETSTIVTEWGLICDSAWISSLIISIQMAGVFVGLFIAGQLADTIGRKKTFFGSIFLIAVLNFVSIFSTSWQMYAVFRFFLGLVYAGETALYFAYPSEFLPQKWRAPMSAFPVWSIAGILFGFACMTLKDWRSIHITTGILAVVSFLPVFWFPESLRWLEAKGKTEQFKVVAKTMAKLNGKTLGSVENSEFISQEASDQRNRRSKKYTLLSLFSPGYKLITMSLGFQCFSLGIVYNSIMFGVKALSGSIYINFIAMNAVTIPLVIFPALVPNILGRKIALFISYLVITLCLIVALCFELLAADSVREIGTVVLIVCVIAAGDSGRPTIILIVSEIYPTVVRGLALGFSYTCGRIGALFAPFLVPRDSEGTYIWYTIMGIFAFLTCCAVWILPETKGKPLKQTFDDVEKIELEQQAN